MHTEFGFSKILLDPKLCLTKLHKKHFFQSLLLQFITINELKGFIPVAISSHF